MIDIKINEHVISMYDGIENMPIVLFSKMQKYQMIESGIGATIGDFDDHFENVIEFLKHDKKDKAIKELGNIRHLFWHSLNEVAPSQLAFCCLIHSINGDEIKDYSESSIEKIRDRLSEMGVTQKIIRDNELKKKSMTN